MTPTILVATWDDGLFAVTGCGRAQEIANQPVRGLAPDGRGGTLAIVGLHSLGRRTPSGEWETALRALDNDDPKAATRLSTELPRGKIASADKRLYALTADLRDYPVRCFARA